MSSQYELVVFDWSGTLSNDFELARIASNRVFAHYGHPGFSVEEAHEKWRMPYINHYRQVNIDASKEEIDGLFHKFYAENNKPDLFPGAKELVLRLKAKKLVLSSHPQHELDVDVKRAGLEEAFDAVVGGVHDKTHRIEELIAGFDKERVVFVGDMLHDLDTAKHAGIDMVAVSWGYTDSKKLLAAGATAVAHSFEELEKIIG